jgi:hypothetical protein
LGGGLKDLRSTEMSTADKESVIAFTPPTKEVLETAWSAVEYAYINSSQVSGNNWDIRFVFSERLPNEAIKPRVGVVMSHNHAKAFLRLLQNTVDNIEKMMGSEIIFKPISSTEEPPKSQPE